MPTKNLTSLTDEILAAEVARRQAESEQAAAKREQQLAAARDAWARQTWSNREQLEQQLVDRGQVARETFSAAVKAGDLPGAFEAWMAERTARYAQEAARAKAQTAGMQIGDPIAGNLPPLRWVDPDFLKRLEEEADQLARANGYELADEMVPDVPAEVQ